MHKKPHVNLAEGRRLNTVWRIFDVLVPFLSIALAVSVDFIGHSSNWWKTAGPNVIPRLTLFLLGLLLLAMIIASIASLIRRKNREVIFLKRRLAEIYLSAIRKSAFNPRLESSTSHD